MEHKKPWQKFMDELSPESELISVYIKLRHAFNREGWSEEDLKNPPYYPQDIMNGYQKMSYLIPAYNSFIELLANDQTSK